MQLETGVGGYGKGGGGGGLTALSGRWGVVTNGCKGGNRRLFGWGKVGRGVDRRRLGGNRQRLVGNREHSILSVCRRDSPSHPAFTLTRASVGFGDCVKQQGGGLAIA